jgi:hypothetical protein
VQACATELNKSNDTVEKFVAHSHLLKSTTLCATTEMQTGVALVDDTKEVLDEDSVEIEDELCVQVVSLSGQLKEVKTMLAQCENNPDERNKAWAKRVKDGIPQVRHKCVEFRKIMLQVRLFSLSLFLLSVCPQLFALN